MDIITLGGSVLFSAAVSTVKELLIEAVKQRKYLQGAYLQGADLQGADLQGADLQGAYLRGAYLQGADLQGADLQGADLQGADLRGADLQGADLQGADLQGADLQGADLQGAYLQGADLQGADLRGALNASPLAIAQLQFIPETGQFEAWKKCQNGVLVKLLIPDGAKRSHGSERKCRASHAEVLEVIGAEVGISLHDCRTEYRKGETVTADSFGEDRWETCSNGIHFYITRLEAENHG